ncbi:MAG TPA: DUF3467 domain-containing protein [Streptosporangiaceae bacterium]|nr:DUF3467 domain-containing protein [Streptosporangiaceae bacterium]
MTDAQPPQPPQISLQVPDDVAAGVYSNLVAVWHTPYEFTLDFAVTQPTQVIADEAGTQQALTPAQVVSRVKIPPAAVFELMQALSKNERLYEERFGPIQRPGPDAADPPMYPPGS